MKEICIDESKENSEHGDSKVKVPRLNLDKKLINEKVEELLKKQADILFIMTDLESYRALDPSKSEVNKR